VGLVELTVYFVPAGRDLSESKVSAEHDKQFFDTFMIVLGGLVAFTIIVYFLANAIADRTQVRYINENPLKAQRIAERLTPVAAVAVTGQPAPAARAMPAALPAATPAPAPAAPAPAAPPPAAPVAAAPAAEAPAVDGEAIYNSSCVACHLAAVAGAPKFGDAEAWASRIAKGIDALYANSINGFQGETGVMPPKGGRLDLDDASIKAAVDYMVAAAQ